MMWFIAILSILTMLFVVFSGVTGVPFWERESIFEYNADYEQNNIDVINLIQILLPYELTFGTGIATVAVIVSFLIVTSVLSGKTTSQKLSEVAEK